MDAKEAPERRSLSCASAGSLTTLFRHSQTVLANSTRWRLASTGRGRSPLFGSGAPDHACVHSMEEAARSPWPSQGLVEAESSAEHPSTHPSPPSSKCARRGWHPLHDRTVTGYRLKQVNGKRKLLLLCSARARKEPRVMPPALNNLLKDQPPMGAFLTAQGWRGVVPAVGQDVLGYPRAVPEYC